MLSQSREPEVPTRAPNLTSDLLPPSDAAATPVDATGLQTCEFQERQGSQTAALISEFGEYHILGRPMLGGMGVVFRARHVKLGRLVALKMLRSGPLATPEEVERFRREAQAAALLYHPHLVPIYEVGEIEKQPYFTMPLMSGGSLGQHMHRYQANLRKAVMLVEKVARGVSHAHEKGILHRDLKPNNVLLDDRDEPMVADFGLAKISGSNLELTRDGQQLGTPAYMAPELTRTQQEEVTPRCDIWALGVLLYELTTCHRPFQGSSVEEIFRKIRTVDPVRPRKLRRGIDRSLEAIILKCLEKDPARRYQSASELADELDRWQRGEPIRTVPDGWGRRSYRFLRRHPLLLTAALAVGFFAVLASLYLYYTDPDRSIKDIEAKLRRGEAVTLIGEQGGPRWSRWAIGQGVAKVGFAGDPYFTISTSAGDTEHLLAVLNDPQTDRYRIDVQVRHNLTGEDGGVVGIGFGYGTTPAAQGKEHAYFELVFADVGKFAGDQYPPELIQGGKLPPPDIRPTLSDCSLAMVRFDEVRPGYGHKRQYSTGVHTLFIPAQKAAHPPPWRQISIEVRPTGVQLFWDGRPMGPPYTREEIVANGREELFAPLTVPNAFGPRGGICLYVWNGSASYRNLVVTPLRE